MRELISFKYHHIHSALYGSHTRQSTPSTVRATLFSGVSYENSQQSLYLVQSLSYRSLVLYLYHHSQECTVYCTVVVAVPYVRSGI